MNIAVIDAESGCYFSRWPHYFNHLALEYNVPHSFLITLIFLWRATVGSETCPEGDLALTQIPVRRKHAMKYLAALSSARFFEQTKGKLGSAVGSSFCYRATTSLGEWRRFFSVLAWANATGLLEDDVSAEEFGEVIGRAVIAKKPPKPHAPIRLADGVVDGETPVPIDEDEIRLAMEVAKSVQGVLRRKRS